MVLFGKRKKDVPPTFFLINKKEMEELRHVNCKSGWVRTRLLFALKSAVGYAVGDKAS